MLFWKNNPIFGGKMDVATTCAPNNLGPLDPNKKLDHWWTSWANCYLEIFRGEPPLNIPMFESF